MELIKDKKIPCLAGGQFVSSAPEKVISVDYVDYICRGEGEGALIDLCNALEEGKDPSNIKNLWVKKNGKVIVVGYEQSCKKDELGDFEMKATYWINKKRNYLPCDSCVTSEASSIQVVK